MSPVVNDPLPVSDSDPRRPVIAVAFAVAILLGVVLSLCRILTARPAERSLWRAAAALGSEEYAEAERLANEVLARSPQLSEALLIAGEAAIRLHRAEAASDYFARVADDGSALAARAMLGQARRFVLVGRAIEAESRLRRLLEIDPYNVPANDLLTNLLQVEGRTWEALPYVYRLFLQGECGQVQLLKSASIGGTFMINEHFVEICRRAVPENPIVLLGEARRRLYRHRIDAAERLLRDIVAKHPGSIEAQVHLGRVILEKSQSEFPRWQTQLPDNADEHPGIWVNRGLWAHRTGQDRAAVRCFLEALVRHPDDDEANYQLAQLLAGIGDRELAGPFSNRSQVLSHVGTLTSELTRKLDIKMVRELAESLESLGRVWEAAGWCDVALETDPQLDWAITLLERTRQKLVPAQPLIELAGCPASQIDLSNYPLPVWTAEPQPARRTPGETMSADDPVTFVDEAQRVGLDFDYFNGTTATAGLDHILQETGGGVAVIDDNGDFWPDVYVTQSCLWPPDANQQQYRDRLFRNLGDGRFQDCTEEAGLGDNRYSQGVTVGDFDNDGFPDLFVSNVGANRFYRNNGDGTFSDISEQAGIIDDRWSLSCVLADVNGDTLLDLYVVNYLVLEEVVARECGEVGRPASCTPTMFTGEQDRLYLNQGNGTFREITQQSGIVAPNGKGLGVVAADFDGSRRLSLFVGNDTTANFFFLNQTPRRGGFPEFTEQAIIVGLALSDRGASQATMGITTGDVNDDGLLDIFVTNFFGETNALYLHRLDHTFADVTRDAGLRDPSLDVLGFGTQFLDANLDGALDLFITNGHVDRMSATGDPDRMPPHFYLNGGDGRFRQLPAERLGPYFSQECFGRSVATLDWNRDGRPDFCVSHLDAPLALLTNRAEHTGSFFAVCLRGTRSDRDAIGSIVRVVAGDRTWTQQLVGGGGYQASSERRLIFGLGQAGRIDQLTVDWPSGLRQEFRDPPVNSDLLWIEGQEPVVQAIR